MNTQIRYLLGGILIGGIMVWAVTTAMPAKIVSTTNTMQKENTMIDAHFIEQMIPHHEGAIEMSKLAQTRAIRPEVKALANAIIDAQTKEIDQMKKWYKDWYGRELPTGDEKMTNHGMMSEESAIAPLEEAPDFDQAFIKEMITHHEMAVVMASMLKAGTQRPEMKELADNVISSQSREIDQMNKWLEDWNK